MKIQTDDALNGVVKNIEEDGPANYLVTVQFPTGSFMKAVVTKNSAQKLGLRIGGPLFSRPRTVDKLVATH